MVLGVAGMPRPAVRCLRAPHVPVFALAGAALPHEEAVMEIIETGTGALLAIRGRFDADAVAQAGRLWEQLLDDHAGDVCIDLADVTFIDSAAIGTITYLFKRLAAGRRKLSLVGVNGQPRRLLEFLRIDRVIEITPTAPQVRFTAPRRQRGGGKVA